MKDKAKKINGKKITLIVLVSFLAALLLAVGLFFGIASCTGKRGDVSDLKEGFTVRKAAPTDGSLPTDHSGIDNIAYMAYVLDNQPYYHAYANNSTKSTGYEQITQTWKDYKSAAVNGTANNVMVCSDLSYSALVKSATQTCFVGGEHAYMRSGNKPQKTSVPSDITWSTDQPTYYTDQTYLKKYGEFSTELSVYVINEETLESCEDVVDNGDGTYSQKFYLSKDAACWYQYGMKTRGSLKSLPDFEKIEITFTFDSNWQVLSSYCEEKTKIAPSALGGVSMSSSSKTTTEFDYTSEGLDGEHFAYFDNYYKQYVGKDLTESPAQTNEEPALLDVLGSAFSKVVDANGNGQQFALDLTLGQTQYTGKIYAKLGDMSDILGSLDVRVALGRKDSGNQDLYIEFANGGLNVYYSDEFAMLVDISSVASAVGGITEWVKSQSGTVDAQAVAYALSGDDEESSLDLDSLLAALDFSYTDTSATISVVTDDLLGFGVGVDLQMNFNRIKEEDGSVYSFRNMSLGGLTYNSDPINLSLELVPDDNSEIISHNKAEAPADLADFINGIYGLLNSNTIMVDIKLDGTCGLEYLNGVQVESTAQLKLEDGFNAVSVFLPLAVKYNGLSAEFEIYYTVNLSNGDYGEIYLNIVSLNDQPYGMKVHCNIGETVDAVKNLIDLINGNGKARTAALSEDAGNSVAEIINAVIGIDYASIIKQLTANGTKISVLVDADEILRTLKFDLGIEFGDLLLELVKDGNNTATLSGSLSALGLSIDISGSVKTFGIPDKNGYIEATELIELVSAAVIEAQKIIAEEDIEFTVDATLEVDGVEMNVNGSGEVIWKDGNIRVAVTAELTITDTADESGEKFNTVSLNFIYDDTQDTFIRLTVNGLGLEISKTDIENVKGGVNEIIASVNNLIGLFTKTEDSGDSLTDPSAANAMTLGEDNVYTQLVNAVLSVVGDITVSLDKELILTHATYGSLSLSADGGLGLDLSVNVNGGEAVALAAFVKAGDATKLNSLNTRLDSGDYIFYTDENSFEKAVYEFIFGVFEDLTVDKILGDGTYTVQINLDGSASGIQALNGITVDANLYYTDKNISNGKKLVQADLNLDIIGTTVKAVVYFTDRTLYVELNEVAGTELKDVAFKASVDDIYSAADTIVKIITSDTLLQIVSKLTGNTAQVQASAMLLEDGTQASSALTEMLTNILSLDFGSLITYEKIGTENVYTITPDSLLEAFGTDIKVGTVTLRVNPESHAIYASVQNGNDLWLTFDAEAVSNSQYGTFSPDSRFIDIGFVSNLLEDILATLESLNNEDGVNVLYSLTGTIKAEISYSVISGSISFNDAVLTVGLDEDEDFYFSLTATLPDSKAKLNVGLSISTVNITTAGSISITYSNGYITFGRDGVYRVMTLNYLLDNALDYTKNGFLNYSNNSPVAWLLGTNSLAWGLVCENIPVSLDSGLTTPHTIGLYELAEAAKENSVFSLSSILNGFEVNANGNKTNYKTCNAVSEIRNKLGLSGNYYAFDINSNSLTGGVIPTLYAAILSGEDGINGLKALANNIGGAVDLSVNFTSRTDSYAPNFYKTVIENHSINTGYSQSIGNHKTNVFGCYDTSKSGEDAYSYTTVLDTVVLHVIDFNGETETYELRYGSTVYLTSLWAPEWTGDNKTYRVIYTDINGNEVGTAYTDSNGNILGKLIVLDDSLFGSSENTHEYTLVIKKAESNIPEKEIVYHVYGIDGIDGIDEIRAAFEVNGGAVSLIKYKLDGYTLLEWYTDEARTEVITEDIAKTFTGNEIYCVYVKDTTTVNGVIYKFYQENGELVYHVNGFVDTGIIEYTEGKTLSLENEIVLGGVTYRVTAIDANAFAEAGLKNVVVPENITIVGENAFLNNYGIQTVVFLAPSVGFEGKYADKTYPFYGCSEVDSGNTTVLKLYYTEIYSVSGESTNYENNPYWSHFRSVSSDKLRYIGNDGGARISENWAYVEFSLNRFATELTELTSGATTYAYTEEQIVNYVMVVLNSLTYADGYINAYKIEVSGGVTLNNSRYTITVTITDLPASERWYAFTAASLVPESTVSYVLPEGQYTVFNGITFVKAGAEIQMSSAGDEFGIFEFDGWTGADTFADATSCETVLTMPAAKTDIYATWSAEFAENIYVTSEVAFYYNGVLYGAGSDVNLTNAAVHTSLANPVAAGDYIFLGWATENGGILNFVNGANTVISEAEAHYYAVWAANHLNDADYSVATEGNSPVSPEAKEGFDGVFYKWYKDAAFTQEITEFTVSDTVVYARMQYSFSLVLAGNDSVFTVTGEFNNSQTVGTYILTFDVLEGESVSISFEEQSGDYKQWPWSSSTTYTWNNCVLTYHEETTISSYKKNNDNNANRRTFELESLTRDYKTTDIYTTTGEKITISDIRSNVTVNGKY